MKSSRIMQVLTASVLALGAVGSSAYAADLTSTPPAPVAPAASAWTSPFDFAFGGKLMTDYISRGITQTNHVPGATAYGEGRYNVNDNWQLYAGTQIWNVKLPTATPAEIDLYGGIRPTFGKFSGDLGFIYYLYPNNTNRYYTGGANVLLNPTAAALAAAGGACPVGPNCATTPANPSYWEVYFKPTYAVTDSLTLGLNGYYSPKWDNYPGVSEGYLSGTAKYAFGTSGFSVSGELGREFLGSTSTNTVYAQGAANRFAFVSYTTWNAGVSYAWKALTLDLRYYGTSLNKTQCYTDTSDPSGNVTGRSNWCGQRVMASLSFDLTASGLK